MQMVACMQEVTTNAASSVVQGCDAKTTRERQTSHGTLRGRVVLSPDHKLVSY